MITRPADAITEPMALAVSEGAVVVLGPRAMTGALTPEAAEESARRLIAAAAEARRARSAQSGGID
jgi:hypothetical protein